MCSDDERNDVRGRIRGRIKSLIERIYVLVFEYKRGRKSIKHMIAQVHFFNGSVRWLELNDSGYGQTEFNPKIPVNRDLRTFKDNPWDLGEWEVSPHWINAEGEWPLVIKK
jgi:hypothetical protein